ncbi:DNA circularization N-terminal domain-containing protein [Pararoseomonas sp. SCSIO 73927]|uniref:DNA circularization N-terminal domain-containing protein n=1 Tax=Pararoseomonas sp. SCSIO 73927 TaxID=3114537 RepID=UPI0030CFAE1E
MSWLEDLRPASWRGLPFGVLEASGRFGRSLAVHDFAFRDSVEIEDLGRAGRRFRIIGFLAGDDAISREAAMIEAIEQEGEGELVHPTLGSLTVKGQELETSWRWDEGGVCECAFFFLEEGKGGTLGGLAGLEDLGATVEKWAGELDLASVTDFARSAGDALKQGVDVVRQAQSTVRGWMSTANGLIGDARSALGAVGAVVPGLDKTLGRFASGLRNPLSTVTRTFSSVDGALSRLSSARAGVTRGVARVSALLDKL